MRVRPGAIGLALLLAVCVWSPALAQGGLAYTVQVAALSEPESAIDQSGALLRDGFPAYVVRAEGAAGTVFRVRVGAFGDRGSADRYARAMGERAGGRPRPALAEAIPAGILPLAPTTLGSLPEGERVVLVPWREDSLALRTGPAEGEGRYDPLGDDAPFLAWWAAPSPGGRREIASVPLDGEAGDDDPPEVREALFRQRLRLVAERSSLGEEELAQAVRGEPGSRHLIVLRDVGTDERVRGVLAADAQPTSREEEDWLGEVPPEPTAPLRVLDTAREQGAAGADVRPELREEAPAAGGDEAAGDDAPAEGEGGTDVADGADGDGRERVPDGEATEGIAGDGWTARADGRWTVLDVGEVSWRALVGTPRAGVADLLVLEVEGTLEIVRLVPR